VRRPAHPAGEWHRARQDLAAAIPGLDCAAADLSFLAPATEPGSIGRLDHYEILEVVGHGAMGIWLEH